MEKEQIYNTLGCTIIDTSATDFPYSAIAGAPVFLPATYTIDIDFWFNQKKIDACVGMGGATIKSIQDGIKLSPRFGWGMAKKRDDYIQWGTSFQQFMKGVQEVGLVPYGTIDESTDVDRDTYMRFELTDELKKLAEPYKGKSYWRPNGWQQVKQALYEQKTPLAAFCDWWTSYNYPVDGWLPPPTGKMVGGHFFVLRGWGVDVYGREYAIFRNSWSKTWGKYGDFYVYVDNLYEYGLGTQYVVVDMPVEVAKIIVKYDGKLIKNPGKPAVYFVKSGKIAAIQNEAVFSFGRAAGFWGDWKDINTVEQTIKSDLTI